MPLRLQAGVNPLKFRATQYVESDNSPEGSFYFDRGQVTSRIQVDYEDCDLAIADFCGRVDAVNSGTGVYYLSRTIPHAWPARPKMFCQAVTQVTPMGLLGADVPEGAAPLAGDGTGQGQSVYDLCELTLNYAMPAYRIRPDLDVLYVGDDEDWNGFPDEGYALEQGFATYSRYVSKVFKPASKTLVLNRGMLEDADGIPIVEGQPFQDPGGEVQYTWHQVPEEYLPTERWITYAGSVNDDTFDGFPAGTLLYDGHPEYRTEPNPITGQYLSTVTYRFKVSLKIDRSVSPNVTRGHKYKWKVKLHAGGSEAGLVPVLWRTKILSGQPGTNPLQDVDFKNFFRPRPAV